MHLDSASAATVRRIVNAIVPAHVQVSVFGSRQHGRCLKPFSDLDLCLKGTTPLAEDVLITLKHAFDDSNLPFRVDLVDWWGVSDEFRHVIAADMKVFLR